MNLYKNGISNFSLSSLKRDTIAKIGFEGMSITISNFNNYFFRNPKNNNFVYNAFFAVFGKS